MSIKTVPKSALEPKFLDAIKAAVGRHELVEKYAYVVGTTSDRAKALETAALANAALTSVGDDGGLRSNVIQIEGQKTFYVTVGGFVEREQALKFKADSTAKVTRLLVAPSGGQEAGLTAASKIKLAVFAGGRTGRQ